MYYTPHKKCVCAQHNLHVKVIIERGTSYQVHLIHACAEINVWRLIGPKQIIAVRGPDCYPYPPQHTNRIIRTSYRFDQCHNLK